MMIFNKGGRIFQHDDIAIKPDAFTEVPDEVADKLLADYPAELVGADDHRKAIAGAGVALAAKDKELAKVKAEDAEKGKQIEELKARLANFEKLTKEESPFPASVKVEARNSGRNR